MDRIEEQFEIEVNGRVYTLEMSELAEKLVIDPAHIEEELEQQSAFYFWIAQLATNAQFAAQDEKALFDIWFSEAQKAVRLKYIDSKAPAQAGIEAEVKSTEEYRERLAKKLEVERKAALLETAKEAVEKRQYTLIERSRRLYKQDAQEHQFS